MLKRGREKELKSLISNDMFEVISFVNQVTVSFWIVSKKYKDSEKKIKARQVACGFEVDIKS